MAKVGVIFGTDTGSTRRVAKSIAKSIGSQADKPVNIRNAGVEDLLIYDVLILGTPTYGEGELPGKSTGNQTESWEEFLPKLKGHSFEGKKVALYGLGNQKSYSSNFASALRDIYDAFTECGAEIIGDGWDASGYKFKFSKAIMDDQFVGLVLDEENQKELTEERITLWLKRIDQAWS
ncbi:flavodoxin [Methylicorpusculum sp.]|uniref:flavodoxin n=1 Tax=Methylicorpusculum sp. TaxID=2713644 RepID=UPI00271A7EE4|nr:flavodoxin [Methylicorpusculum sp.]MDO8844448.1 flavodoxin [Methylicorpusculum sp.]